MRREETMYEEISFEIKYILLCFAGYFTCHVFNTVLVFVYKRNKKIEGRAKSNTEPSHIINMYMAYKSIPLLCLV